MLLSYCVVREFEVRFSQLSKCELHTFVFHTILLERLKQAVIKTELNTHTVEMKEEVLT